MISAIIAAVFAVVYLLATVWLCRGVKLNARACAWGASICALTLVLATIRIPLPTGSNITCGSWIPLMLLALLYDYRLSMVTRLGVRYSGHDPDPRRGRRSTGRRSSCSSWCAFPAWATPASSAPTSAGRLSAA